MPHISVVIPVYQSEPFLYELYRRLQSSLELVSEDFEIIFVEDCGKDRSWEVINDLSKQDARVRGIQFSRNFGQHYGITAGLDNCNGDWVVVMDADLQDQPEEIPRLYNKAQEGYDIVLARRGNRKDPWFQKLCAYCFYQVFSYLTEIDYDPQVGNFRIMSRKVVESFRAIREQLRFFGGLVDWTGFPSSSVDVEHASRSSGKSSYTFRKRLKLATDAVIAYSDKPLRLSVKFGFLIAFLAFLGGVWIFIRALLYGLPVLGWGSLIISLYFLGGIIIFNLGIIGVYLGKTFNETKKRPLYLIRNTTANLIHLTEVSYAEQLTPFSSIRRH